MEVLSSAINHRLYPTSVRESVLHQLAHFGDVWTESPTEAEAYKIGTVIFEQMERGESSVGFLHALMSENWNEVDEEWSTQTLLSLRRAMSDLWQKKDA